MRCLIVLVALVALAAAAPKINRKNIGFRNLYVEAKNGKPHPNPRIIGGQEAEPHSIPYQGFLEAESLLEGWYCGASLIKDNYLLTAGHCLQDEFGLPAEQALITLGAHRVLEDEDTQVRLTATDGINQHPEYDPETFVGDIGLIKLPETVGLTDIINTVALPTDDSNDYTGAAAQVSGWGLTDGEGTTLSEVLNVLQTEIISNEDCNEQLGGNYIKPNNICISGEKSTGTCSGDSGGPLTVNGVQVGAVSFGLQGCPPGYPSAFTRLTAYLDWINANTQ